MEKQYKVISFDLFQTLVNVNENIFKIWDTVLPNQCTQEQANQYANELFVDYATIMRHEMIKSKFITSFAPASNNSPITIHIAFPVLSSSVINPINEGIIINKVHQPLKKILILNNPSELPPKINPIIIKIIPHKMFLKFFISISFLSYH